MRYSAYIIWLILSAIMCILILPAMIADVCGWFEIGDKIQEDNKALHHAKEMEKQQIMLAIAKHLPIEDGVITAVQKAEQYYDENFGGSK